MTQISRLGIEELIARYTKTYLDNPSMMLSGYRQEMQTVADYTGRQLLELLQNADDAGTDVVRIALNRQNYTLSISNNGEPFILEGVESLMYTGLSTKNKEEYIGNKGLGFRSVLSWVDSVEIHTREVSFRFSEEYSKKYFKENLLPHKDIQDRLRKEKKQKKIAEGEIPAATLAFPELLEQSQTAFVTTIILNFKPEELPKILEQLEAISEESLLFLPHIREIVVIDDIEKRITKKQDSENAVTVNDAEWHILRKLNLRYNDKVKFNFAIAWQDAEVMSGRFYTYFPTDVETDLPCIIHATFDLTNNRKEINNNDANKYILQQIAESLGEIAHYNLKKDTADWDAYKFLTPKHNNSRAVFSDFYKSTREIRESIGVYPTVDNQYLKITEVYYYGDDFSDWVVKNGFGKFFPCLLRGKIGIALPRKADYSFEEFNKIVEQINPLLNIKQRAELIAIITRNNNDSFSSIHKNVNPLPLLVDSTEKIVSSEVQVFTKESGEADFELPDYIGDVAFISSALYRQLSLELTDEIALRRLDNESGDSRALKRLLSPVVNIGSNDIIDVIQHLVRQTNERIKNAEQPFGIVKKMVAALFSIYKTNKNRRGNLNSVANIPLISRSENLLSSASLYFGAEFQVGQISELIFKDFRTDDNYLIGNNFWQLEADDESLINFFQWLNVNTLSRYTRIQKTMNRWESDPYTVFVLKSLPDQRTDVYKSYDIEKLEGLEDFLLHPEFTIEKLIAWIAKDDKFQEKLKINNSDLFTVEFSRDIKTVSEKLSFIAFLIHQSGITDNVVLSPPFDDVKSLSFLDAEHKLFKELEVPEYKIKEVADLLGIRQSFNSISPDLVYELLQKHTLSEVSNSQQFYKLVYEYFRSNEKTQLISYTPNFAEIYYFCRKGGLGRELDICPVTDVYYSDNKLLPQKILNQYSFINLPKRIGENRVKKFFGVKLIKDIISDVVINVERPNRLEGELNTYINQLKPFFLAYRLEALQKIEEKEEAARSIKSFRIKLVREASFKMKSGEFISFENHDSITKGDEFFICSNIEVELSHLRSSSEFCDIIAEALCIVFKVNEYKNVFRRIFRDGNIESLHLIKIDEKEEYLKQAKKFMGVSEEEQTFWAKLIDKEIAQIEDETILKKRVEHFLGAPLPSFYHKVDFSNLGTGTGVSFLTWLFENTEIDLKILIGDTTLERWHSDNLANCVKDYINTFDKLLWLTCEESENQKDKEEFFKNTIKFDNAVSYLQTDFISENAYNLNPDYVQAVKNWTEKIFNINLDHKVSENVAIRTKYKHIIKNFSFDLTVDLMEKQIKQEDELIYSLMYFDGFEDLVRGVCERLQNQKVKEIAASEDPNDDEIDSLSIIETGMSISHHTSSNLSNKKNKGGSHTSKNDARKAIAGKKQEDRVKKALRKAGYLVNDKSSKTDGHHYDLEYKRDGDKEWRFLEVKQDSGGFFYLSKWEKETAVSSAFCERYDVAIVDDYQINIIKAPFFFNEESFAQNKRFYAEPTEYKISFKLNGIKE